MVNFPVILFFILSFISGFLCTLSTILHIYRYVKDPKSRTFKIELIITTSILATLQQIGFMATVVLEEFTFPIKDYYNEVMRQVEWQFLEGVNSVVAVCGTFLGAVVFLSMLPSVKVIPRQGYVDFFSNRYLFYGLIVVFLLQSTVMGFAKPQFVAISIYQSFLSFTGVVVSTTIATTLLLYWYSKLTNMTGAKSLGSSKPGDASGESSSKPSKSNETNTPKSKVNSASKGAIFRTILMFELCSLACVFGIIDRLGSLRRQGPLFDKAEFLRRDVSLGIRTRHLHALIGFVIGVAFLNSEETKKLLVSFIWKEGRRATNNGEISSGRRSANDESNVSQSASNQA